MTVRFFIFIQFVGNLQDSSSKMYKEMRKEAADTLREHKAKVQKERKKWGHEYVLYNNSVSYFQAESYWFVYWRWWKTHFMDSNKPLFIEYTDQL